MSQHLEALELANRIRLNGAELRREVAAGLPISAALLDDRAQALPIARLLSSQKRWGERRTWTLLHGMHISPTKRVRDLTDRQVAVIAQATDRHLATVGSAAAGDKMGGSTKRPRARGGAGVMAREAVPPMQSQPYSSEGTA